MIDLIEFLQMESQLPIAAKEQLSEQEQSLRKHFLESSGTSHCLRVFKILKFVKKMKVLFVYLFLNEESTS